MLPSLFSIVASSALRPRVAPRGSHAVALCSTDSSRTILERLPPQFVAPYEPPEEGSLLTLDNFEIASLHRVLHKMAPAASVGEVSLEQIPEDITVDVGMRRLKELALSSSHLLVDGAAVPWKFLAKIAKKQRSGVWHCYEDDDPMKVEGLSDLTSRPASLQPMDPTPGGPVPPTAVLGSFRMHRTKDVTPAEDTARKLAALSSIGGGLRGRVLDVCTGLGYTAIDAARHPSTSDVVTIELDPLMVYLQRSNPWSADLFTSEKIHRLLGDATEVVPELPEGFFDVAIHDPPSNHMSGELYSQSFYSAIRRTLRTGGRFYHYVGDPKSQASGRMFKGILERLRESGFENPKTVARAYGIVAVAR